MCAIGGDIAVARLVVFAEMLGARPLSLDLHDMQTVELSELAIPFDLGHLERKK